MGVKGLPGCDDTSDADCRPPRTREQSVISLGEDATDAFTALQFVGRAPCMLDTLRVVRSVARTDAPGLIAGETGTGKELAARAVHYLGPRSSKPFIPVNCGALPESLLASELFGYERGAFTDAKNSQPGLVRLAEGGTLFLDEVDALSPRAQVSLLRFLQDGEFRAVGGNHMMKANVRIISAGNSPLSRLSQEGAFRADLLFRLAVVSIHLPPLRERVGDIPLLSEHFVAKCAATYGSTRKKLTPATLALLESYEWPGNVRELQNFIHGAYVLSEGDTLVVPESSVAGPTRPPPALVPSETDYEGGLQAAKLQAIERVERDYLAWLLGKTQGNVSAAARVAGQDRRVIGRLLKKHGIDRLRFSQA